MAITIEVKPKTIRKLILEEVENTGKYLLPSFQRQFVWDPEDIKKLIDSIFRNYPIGAIIAWKPSTAIISDIDPAAVPLMGKEPKLANEYLYVIDGQQRLTSLLLLFNNWKIERGPEVINYESTPISYNPASRKFTQGRRGVDLSRIVRAYCLRDPESLRQLQNEYTHDTLREIEQLAARILDYELPVYVMQTTDENEQTFSQMAEAFIRVNDNGVKIGNLELMLSFMAGTIRGELKGMVSQMNKKVFDRMEVENTPVFRFVFQNFGLKQSQITKTEQFQANIARLERFTAEQQKDIFERSEAAFMVALDLIENEFGIRTTKLIPSQNTIVPLAAYMYKQRVKGLADISDSDRKNLASWFFFVNYARYYSSSPDTKLNRDLELIGSSNHFPYTELIAHMSEKRVKVEFGFNDIAAGMQVNALKKEGRNYLFLLYTVLYHGNVDDWSGRQMNGRKYNELGRHHIFPQEYLNEVRQLEDSDNPEESEIFKSNIANITFIDAEINSEIGSSPPEEYLKQYLNTGRAQQHFIPEDQAMLRSESYEEFLEYRIKAIYYAVSKIFPELFRQERIGEISIPKITHPSLGHKKIGIHSRLYIQSDTLLFLKARGANAQAHPTGSGKSLLVIKSSKAAKKDAHSFKSTARSIRDQLISQGVLKDCGDYYEFTQDFEFKSPSAAARSIMASNANGWKRWKNGEGQTLDELNRAVTESR